MTAPRIEIDLTKIRHNARSLVGRLNSRGITVTGVTKAACGHPDIAKAMLEGGVTGLADARLTNVKRMRKAGITCPITMIRTPMLSQVGQIVQCCETSYNTEIGVIAKLAAAARRRNTVHDIILMVEMGDRREGIMPEDLEAIASQVVMMPGIALKGIGANFACLGEIEPDPEVMVSFSKLANDVEGSCGPVLETVSGGSSANLIWAFGLEKTGRVNNLRLGEAILLGVDPVSGDPLQGLHTDAFTLVAEVIETKSKPEPGLARLVYPAHSASGLVQYDHRRTRSILAVGLQDTDAARLTFPLGVNFVGATSDHTVVETTSRPLQIGTEMKLQLNYSALMRTMNAPDVAKVLFVARPLKENFAVNHDRRYPALV